MNAERKRNNRYLSCSCCGAGFEGMQARERDTGYGTCPKCIRWILGRKDWDYNHDLYRQIYLEQFGFPIGSAL